jgi:hypothetical protein
MRDTETGGSKGYAFINYASFEASDAGEIFFSIFLVNVKCFSSRGNEWSVFVQSTNHRFIRLQGFFLVKVIYLFFSFFIYRKMPKENAMERPPSVCSLLRIHSLQWIAHIKSSLIFLDFGILIQYNIIKYYIYYAFIVKIKMAKTLK